MILWETEDLLLRPLKIEDADGNYPGWLNDKEVCRYNSHGEIHYTKQMAIDYIKMVNSDATYRVFAIIFKENEKHIGNVSLQNISKRNGSAEFAILIGEKDYYGKGLSKQAGRAVFKHGFEELNLHRIYCGTSIYNIPMQKLAQFLGMKREGQRIEAFYKNGEYVDTIEYGILKKDFSGEVGSEQKFKRASDRRD
jgi:RimJ/RimL family protein N-acetyltransferase